MIKEDELILAIGCKNFETSPKKVTKDMKIYSSHQEP